jgi:hypothetical protein
MEQGIKGAAYDKYQEFKKNQGVKISNEDFETKIVSNIFDEDDIKVLYEAVNSTPKENIKVMEWGGLLAWHCQLPSQIVDKINIAVKRDLGDHLILRRDYSFARYTQHTGWKNKLHPHSDTRPSQRVTFDIQIKADEEWGIIVEDKTYHLQDGQALVFAGTQQTHWREKKDIKKDSVIDMIFCHLEYVDDLPHDEDQDQILAPRHRFLCEFYDLHGNDVPYDLIEME